MSLNEKYTEFYDRWKAASQNIVDMKQTAAQQDAQRLPPLNYPVYTVNPVSAAQQSKGRVFSSTPHRVTPENDPRKDIEPIMNRLKLPDTYNMIWLAAHIAVTEGKHTTIILPCEIWNTPQIVYGTRAVKTLFLDYAKDLFKAYGISNATTPTCCTFFDSDHQAIANDMHRYPILIHPDSLDLENTLQPKSLYADALTPSQIKQAQALNRYTPIELNRAKQSFLEALDRDYDITQPEPKQ